MNHQSGSVMIFGIAIIILAFICVLIVVQAFTSIAVTEHLQQSADIAALAGANQVNQQIDNIQTLKDNQNEACRVAKETLLAGNISQNTSVGCYLRQENNTSTITVMLNHQFLSQHVSVRATATSIVCDETTPNCKKGKYVQLVL